LRFFAHAGQVRRASQGQQLGLDLLGGLARRRRRLPILVVVLVTALVAGVVARGGVGVAACEETFGFFLVGLWVGFFLGGPLGCLSGFPQAAGLLSRFPGGQHFGCF